MRRLAILLLCLSLASCHGARARRAGKSANPERREAVDSMSGAEAEAQKPLSNW